MELFLPCNFRRSDLFSSTSGLSAFRTWKKIVMMFIHVDDNHGPHIFSQSLHQISRNKKNFAPCLLYNDMFLRRILRHAHFVMTRFNFDICHKHLSRHEKTNILHKCENKDADQLHSNCKADQCLCFRYTNSITPLFSKSKISSC